MDRGGDDDELHADDRRHRAYAQARVHAVLARRHQGHSKDAQDEARALPVRPARAAAARAAAQAPLMPDAPAFCRPVDATPRLAVLGILGVESQSAVRRSIRRSWLPGGAEADILPLFVLRGLNASASTLAEAEEHGDSVFLRAEASQSRFTGPLWSLWLWLDCARTAWPHAKLIGKAESDVWLHLPGIATRLRADFEALGRRDPQ